MAETYANQSPYHFAGNNPVGNREINGAVYQSLEKQDWERGVNESGVLRGSSSLDNAIGQADAYDAAVYDYSSNRTYLPRVGAVNKNDVVNLDNSQDGPINPIESLRNLESGTVTMGWVNGKLVSVSVDWGPGFSLPLIPDAKSISIDIDLVFGGEGFDKTPWGRGFIFRGKDRGKFFKYTSNADASNTKIDGRLSWIYGLDGSIAVQETNYYYLGNIDNFGIDSFNGISWEINGAISAFVDLGLSVAISPVLDDQGGRLLAIGASIGGGVPLGGGGNVNINYTKARLYKKKP